MELQQQLEILEQEAQHLRQSNTELQLKGDIADGEKEEKQDELERLMREREYMWAFLLHTFPKEQKKKDLLPHYLFFF